MFIIVANKPYIKKDIHSYDVLSLPSGKPMLFGSKTEAVHFLQDLSNEHNWNQLYIENANIKNERVH